MGFAALDVEAACLFGEGRDQGYDYAALQHYDQLNALSHEHHAGNSPAMVDGASLVLIANEETARRLQRMPRARIRPSCITRMRSQLRIVERRWAMMIAERPSSR